MTYLVGRARLPIFIAFAAAGLVLLIACTNIANLLLVRAMGREREMAVRSALGAGRRRLLQQQVAESLVLTLAGGAFGLVFAVWLSRILLAYEPDILPLKDSIAFDLPVLLFALGVSLVTGVVFGLVSALHRIPSLSGALKEGGAQLGEGHRQNRLRMALVGSQIALALTLLVAAGLLTKALYQLTRVDPGFRPADVYSSHIILGSKYRVTEESNADEVEEESPPLKAPTSKQGGDSNGRTTRFAESPDFDCPNGITFDASGYFIVASFNNGYLVRVSPDGEAETWVEVPEGRNAHLAATEDGLYVTKIESNRIYRIDHAGTIEAFAGTGELGLDDGPALEATLARPNGIAVSPDGRLLYVNNLEGPWRGSEPTNIILRRIALP